MLRMRALILATPALLRQNPEAMCFLSKLSWPGPRPRGLCHVIQRCHAVVSIRSEALAMSRMRPVSPFCLSQKGIDALPAQEDRLEIKNKRKQQDK